VDPADLLSIQGIYPGFTPAALPATPGLEGVGTIAELGPHSSKVHVGQRVVPYGFRYAKQGRGTWAEFIVVHEDDVFPVPEGVSDEDAAHSIVNPVTIVGLLEKLKVPKGQWLLQTAAGSTLGRQLIQVTKHDGINTLNLVRRQEQVAELEHAYRESKGEGHVRALWSEDPEIDKKIKEITGGHGVYAALDAVGGKLAGTVGRALRDGGEAILYGVLGGLEVQVSAIDLLFRSIVYTGFWITTPFVNGTVEQRHRMLEQAFDWIKKGIIASGHGKIFPLKEAAQAVALTAQPGRAGKVLLSN